MENPGARLHQIPNTRSQTGKLISTAFVGAVHVVAIWALVTGLAGKIVQSVPKVIEAKIIQTTPPKKKKLYLHLYTPEKIIDL